MTIEDILDNPKQCYAESRWGTKRRRLLPGDASKLAGKLSWGCSNAFKRFGRAMLRLVVGLVRKPLVCVFCRPLFDQVCRKDGSVDVELEAALEWWYKVLELNICELRPWEIPISQPVHLFVDASGSPPYLGAVAFYKGEAWFTHMAPSRKMMEHFRSRGDNQIMGLELLAISLGLSTFEELLEGRKVVIHSDNSGSEVSIRRGTARALDHAQLVHAQWFHIVRLRAEVFVKRVGTHDNIADLPSRADFGILRDMGVTEVRPQLEVEYQGDAWEVLQERWKLGRPAPMTVLE